MSTHHILARRRVLATVVMVLAALIGYFMGGDPADAHPSAPAPAVSSTSSTAP